MLEVIRIVTTQTISLFMGFGSRENMLKSITFFVVVVVLLLSVRFIDAHKYVYEIRRIGMCFDKVNAITWHTMNEQTTDQTSFRPTTILNRQR